MASSYLEVGSQGLTELKNDLTNLSKALHELFELMNADMRQVGEAWRDSKYEEFVSGYKPKIAKCEEISERYAEWCKKVLEPAIADCINYEKSNLGGDNSGSTGSGINGGGADNTGGSLASSSNNDKFAGFNMGNNNPKSSERPRSPQPQPWPYNQRNKQQGLHWDKPYSTPQPPTSTSRPTPPPSKPSDSGFDPRENERPHLSPAEIAQLLNGRQR